MGFEILDDGPGLLHCSCGNEDVVDPDSENSDIVNIFASMKVDAWVGSGSSESELNKEGIELFVPFSRRLLESIQWLLKAPNESFASWLYKSLGLFDVQLLIQISMKESGFYVELI